MTTFALQRDRRQASPDDFPQQLAELLAYLEDDFPADHPFARLAALPGRPRRRSRGCSAPRRRARSGPASSASPTRSRTSSTATARRSPPATGSEFEPGRRLPAPRTAVAVWALCAEDDEEAERLTASQPDGLRHARARAADPRAARREGAALPGGGGRRRRAAPAHVAGDARGVRAGLEAVAEEYGAEEVIVVTITHDHAARRRSYELHRGGLRPGGRRCRRGVSARR